MPRWTLVVFLAVLLPFTFFPNESFTQNTLALSLLYLTYLGEFAIIAVVQLYRYRAVSSPLQRQQTKWVVYGLAVLCTVIVVGVVLLIGPALFSPSSLYQSLALVVVGDFLLLLIPLSFGFAMLRYRLWDIDILIRRTLVYGTLTAILTGVYVGLVIGLQALLRGIINQDSSVAIVISTLAIAALFQPLRRRIQRIIDRRFYRSKYDAAKTVAVSAPPCARKSTWSSCASSCWPWCRKPCSLPMFRSGCVHLNKPAQSRRLGAALLLPQKMGKNISWHAAHASEASRHT